MPTHTIKIFKDVVGINVITWCFFGNIQNSFSLWFIIVPFLLSLYDVY